MIVRLPVIYPAGPYHGLLLRHAPDEPARSALQVGDRAVSIGELAANARRLASGLCSLGVERGDRIALDVPNGVEAILAFLAASIASAAVVPVNPSYRERELRHLLEDSGATTLIVGERQWPIAAAALADVPALRHVVVAGAAPKSHHTRFADLLVEPPAEGRTGEAGHDLALLPYSSGTMGLPKGVMLTHRNLVTTIVQFKSALAVGPDDVLLNFLPLSHIYGLMATGAALAARARVVLMERFDLEHVLACVERHSATVLFAVPPVIAALAESPEVERYDLSSLRLINTGGAPQPSEPIRRVARRTGVPVIVGYGLTEAAPTTHSPVPPPGTTSDLAERWSTTRAGGVGFAVNDTDLRIVDAETGARALGPGEAGELLVRGPQVMQGYWNRPRENAEVLRDGYVTIVGRKKELIKYRGFSIAPAEIEAVLLTHPDVVDCAVVGRSHREHGEVPVGFVVVRSAAETSVTSLLDFAALHLAGYKRLHAIEIVSSIPRSPSGKILRQALR
jgi:long-chain acyl-CoA synthetase